ncbi:hypothetical protein CAEBREN_11569 [Caenorhabditis brenneri]|uniref:Uncharacterized protein n=1 Tax=Caenorhabditis brenneri TaxID=135651 RepID=G0P678_CAEBE|nr:hypothetical protein CAEBREN_11569 [Caenorhabditis brenneri]
MSESLSLCAIIIYLLLVCVFLMAVCLCKVTYRSAKVGATDNEVVETHQPQIYIPDMIIA